MKPGSGATQPVGIEGGQRRVWPIVMTTSKLGDFIPGRLWDRRMSTEGERHRGMGNVGEAGEFALGDAGVHRTPVELFTFQRK